MKYFFRTLGISQIRETNSKGERHLFAEQTLCAKGVEVIHDKEKILNT